MIKPRFSLRILAIFVTLIAAYFGAWEATKQAMGGREDLHSPLPLVIGQDEIGSGQRGIHVVFTQSRQYYLWVFGPKIRLPYRPTTIVTIETLRKRGLIRDVQQYSPL